MTLSRRSSLSIRSIADQLYDQCVTSAGNAPPVTSADLQAIVIEAGDSLTVHGSGLVGFDGAVIDRTIHISGRLSDHRQLCAIAYLWCYVLRSRLAKANTTVRYYCDIDTNPHDFEAQVARAFERRFISTSAPAGALRIVHYAPIEMSKPLVRPA